MLKAAHWVCDRTPRRAPSCGASHSRRPRLCVDIRSRYASSPCAKRPSGWSRRWSGDVRLRAEIDVARVGDLGTAWGLGILRGARIAVLSA